MVTTRDLETVIVATADVAAAVETFRKSFGFAVTREPKGGSGRLRIGPAEIEMVRAGSDAAGLHAIVLRVESLEAARRELERRGLAVATGDADGRPALLLGPEGTNGARLVLVEG